MLDARASSQLLAPPSRDATPRRCMVSCKQIRDSYSVRTSNWKPQSTYVQGQCEYAVAESMEACRIAACTNVETSSWNSIDCRAADFVCLRKSSHRGKVTQRLSKKLESLPDRKRSLESVTSSAVLVNQSESCTLRSTLFQDSQPCESQDPYLGWARQEGTGADNEEWLMDMPTRPASDWQASTASSLNREECSWKPDVIIYISFHNQFPRIQ